MTEQEFLEIFLPLATVWTKSIPTSKEMSGPYYSKIKDYPLEVFRRAAAEINDVSPMEFPKPNTLQSVCITMDTLIKAETNQPTPEPSLAEIGNRPQDHKARREFYEKLGQGYNAKDERESFMKTGGFVTLKFAIVDAVILAPAKEQRDWKKKQERRTTNG